VIWRVIGKPAVSGVVDLCFLDFLYQSRPISPESLAGQFGFKETGAFIINAVLFSFPPYYVTIIAIVASHLLSLIGDVRACPYFGALPFLFD
jgi:hypothetical protein